MLRAWCSRVWDMQKIAAQILAGCLLASSTAIAQQVAAPTASPPDTGVPAVTSTLNLTTGESATTPEPYGVVCHSTKSSIDLYSDSKTSKRATTRDGRIVFPAFIIAMEGYRFKIMLEGQAYWIKPGDVVWRKSAPLLSQQALRGGGKAPAFGDEKAEKVCAASPSPR